MKKTMNSLVLLLLASCFALSGFGQLPGRPRQLGDHEGGSIEKEAGTVINRAELDQCLNLAIG